MINHSPFSRAIIAAWSEFAVPLDTSQITFTCLKATIETLENDVK